MGTEIISSSGLPNEITTPKIINKNHNIVLNDPKMEVRKIADVVSLSTEHVVNISHTYLFIKKQCNFHAFNYLSPNSQHFNTILFHYVIFIITFFGPIDNGLSIASYQILKNYAILINYKSLFQEKDSLPLNHFQFSKMNKLLLNSAICL